MKKRRKLRRANGKARLTRRQLNVYSWLLRSIKGNNKDFVEGYYWWHNWSDKNQHNIGWSAYLFAKEWGGREGVDVKKLQTAVIKFGTPKNIYLFARDVPEANINRLQYEIIKRDDVHWIRLFARNIPGAKKNLLEKYAMIAEIMDSF